MIKRSFFSLSFLMLLIVGCKEKEPVAKLVKEIKVYQISYQWRAAEVDSIITLKEQTWFDKDSNITKYINHLNGYYYEIVRDETTGTVKESHYTLDSVLMYSSIAELDSLGRQVRADYYDAKDLMYAIKTDYLGDSEVVERQVFIYPEQQERHLIYRYNEEMKLVQQLSVFGSDSFLIEEHHRVYDKTGMQLTDSIVNMRKHSYILEEYQDNKLFYQINRNISDSKNEEDNKYYLKKYFMYNPDGNMTEIRRMRVFPDDDTFEKEGRTLISWQDKQRIQRRTDYNTRARKVYALHYEYTYWK